MFAIAPILAAPDLGGLLGIAFLVISFIGWVSNLVSKQQQQQQQQQQPPQRGQRRPQNRKVRDEIEAFLQEATGQPRRQPPRANRDVEVLDADEIEVVSTPERRRPSRPKPQRRAAPSAPARQLVPPKAAPNRLAPGQEVSDRHVPSSALGQSLKQHVNSHMAERMGQLASQNVEPTVDDSVAAHMGEFTADDAIVRRRAVSQTPDAAALLKMLRSPMGVKQAYILGEVLNPPVSLRRKRQ